MVDIAIEEIDSGVFYSHHPDHRNRTKNKSQWLITLDEETTCFRSSLNQGWLFNNIGWGLHFQDGNLTYLGFAQDHGTRVFVAKFVDSNNQQSWHGYPADHRRNLADIPTQEVLSIWLNGNIIGAAKIRKLCKGQPCSL